MSDKSDCKSCVLSQVCELKKNKHTPCSYKKIGYTERRKK